MDLQNSKATIGMDSRSVVLTPVKIEDRKKLEIRAGDTVRVHQKIKEKGKFRLQVFEGLVLAVKHGKESGGTFTVRKTASGVGVERVFPIYSPMIDKIEIIRRSKVRRSKLYHIREKAAKEVRRQMRNIRNVPDVSVVDESVVEEKPEENKEDQEVSIENEKKESQAAEQKEEKTQEEPKQENK